MLPIKFFLILIFLFIFFFYSLSPIFAASITLSQPNVSTLADFEEEYQINVDLSINTADNTKYYLRGIFYQAGSNKYCGTTWNGNSWYNGPYTTGDGWKNLPEIVISSNSASIVLKAKLDPDDNDCQKNGNYSFKVQRYTQAGSQATDPQNEQQILVDITLPSPTSAPLPTVKKIPSITPISSKTPAITSSIVISPSITKLFISQSTSPTAILSQEYQPTDITNNESSSSSVLGVSNNNKSLKIILLPLTLGIISIFSAAFISFQKLRSKNGF